MASLSELLGGRGRSIAEQLVVWAVLQQLIGTALQPVLQGLQREINDKAPLTPLTPADLADMVVRNIIDQPGARDYAAQSGIAGADFDRLVHVAGNPPSPQELIAALRRGVIPAEGRGPTETSFEQGIAESRLFDKWRAVLLALADVPLDPALAVDAVVESQIPFDQGAHEAFLSGVSADHFRVMVDTRGNPPSPTELNELYKRGLIPLEGTGPDQLSVQQGIFEGATKNKWWRQIAALAEYRPPPRTVTAMVREGSLTDEAALKLLQESGLKPDLAAAYLTSAHHQKTQAQRDLTVSDVTRLYQDQFIDRAQATQMLEALRYTGDSAHFLLDIADFQLEEKQVRAAVSRLHNLYVGHRIALDQASRALDGLGIPAGGRDQMLTTWSLEREANVRIPTEGQIVSAFHYQIVDQDQATLMLRDLGYSAYHAWLLLSEREHKALPNKPALGG